MPNKLFITDFDGTLLNTERKIHPEDIQTLKMLQTRGIVTAIATGRSLYSFKKALTSLGELPVDYVIFSTGAGILDFKNNNVFYQKTLQAADIAQVLPYLDANCLDYMVLKANPDARHFYFKSFNTENPDFFRRLALYKDFAVPMPHHLSVEEPAVEILVILPEQQGLSAIDDVRRNLSGFSVIHATSPLDHQSVWIEIFDKNVSKSKSAAVLADRLSIEPKDVIGVGNDFNDQDLLAWTGHSFVVENAPPSLKQEYTIVSSNNNKGVSEAARRAGLMPAYGFSLGSSSEKSN